MTYYRPRDASTSEAEGSQTNHNNKVFHGNLHLHRRRHRLIILLMFCSNCEGKMVSFVYDDFTECIIFL